MVFLTASAAQLMVHYSIALFSLNSVLGEGYFSTSVSVAVGVIAGITFASLGNRYAVCWKSYIRKRSDGKAGSLSRLWFRRFSYC
jgi:hypothetical protein